MSEDHPRIDKRTDSEAEEAARQDYLETIVAVKQGLLDVAAGRTRPIREVLAELAAKHRLT